MSSDEPDIPIPIELADEFLKEFAAGNDPDIDDFARRIPEAFEEIREYLELLTFSAGLRPDRQQATATCPDISGYDVHEMIGQGGMGSVFRATHRLLKRDVAVKILNPERVANSSLRERFLQEAQAVSGLKHRHIVSVLDFGETTVGPYLVMELIDGVPLNETLQSFIRQANDSAMEGIEMSGGLVAADFDSIAKIGHQAASALSHAHSRRAIHRDIKPANLLLDAAGDVHITDFGLVKLLDTDAELSRTGDMIGTPRYMAPEQVLGQCDERSDVYGLGITLYELASGQKAWDAVSGVDSGNLLEQKSRTELPAIRELNPDVPDCLAAIIMKACAFRPEDRHQTAEALQQDLEACRDGIPKLQHLGGLGENAKRKRPHPFAVYSVIALAASIAVLLLPAPFRRNSELSPDAHAFSDRPIPVDGVVRITEQDLEVGNIAIPDQQSDPVVSWSITGPDSSRFQVNENGLVTCRQILDFERAMDVDHDNEFDLQVVARRTSGIRHTFPLSVLVTDVDETPVFRPEFGSRTISPGGSVFRGTVRADDPEGFGFSWSVDPKFNDQVRVDLFGRIYDCASAVRPLTVGSQIDVYADDRVAQRVMLIYGNGTRARYVDPNGTVEDQSIRIQLPSETLGVATCDGETFFCLHDRPNDSSLSLSTSDLQTTNPLLQNCGIPLTAHGLATSDGIHFMYSNAGVLWSFSLLGEEMTTPRPIRVLGRSNPNIASCRADGIQLFECEDTTLYPSEYRDEVGYFENEPLLIPDIGPLTDLCLWQEHTKDERGPVQRVDSAFARISVK